MLIPKSTTVPKQNSPTCTVWEYDFPSTDFSFAIGLIHGRYPTENRAVNQSCAELYYILSGTGTIHSTKGDFPIAPGDLYFFEKAEAYWVEGHQLSIALINAPKWTFDQYKIVD